MIYFRSDYSLGAHDAVLEALQKTNSEHTDGYGLDPYCERAAALIRDWTGLSDCDVHFMVGGTPCNITVAAAALSPYESVLSARSGHAYIHETGGIEATGHRVVAVSSDNGKLTPASIAEALSESTDEHQPHLGMVYISQPTEIGTVYTKAEMSALSAACQEHNLLLYVDGARLPMALTSRGNDLTIRDLAALADAFYIGGTKCGALFGEALVLKHPRIRDHFRWMIKRQGGLLAKGRLLGVQFAALLEGGEDSVYLRAAAHANEMADHLRDGLQKLGVPCLGSSTTNQIFPILPVDAVKELEKEFFFYEWEDAGEGRVTLRLVTSFGTRAEEVQAFLERLTALLQTPPSAKKDL